MLRRPPLRDAVVDLLRARVRALAEGSEGRLPSELRLAEELGVSRQTVREALRMLEGEGLVVRRRGVGSFVARRGGVEAGLERLESFWDTIRQSGHTPNARLLYLGPAALPEGIAEALGVASGTPGFRADTLYFADDQPVLLSVVYLPPSRVRSMEVLERRRDWTSMREFFQHGLGIPAHYARLTVLAEAAPAPIARLLGVRRGAPLLVMEGVTFGEEDERLMFTRAYFRTDKYRFTLVRR